EDALHLLRRLFCAKTAESGQGKGGMGRADFLSRAGAIAAGIPFLSFGYGIARGRFDFRVVKQQISFPSLPRGFDGLRIVHISDLHLGSFFNAKKEVLPAVRMVNELHPDLLLFTGDMVNNLAEETEGWEDIIGSMEAKMGKYAVLGNHDYGDYAAWPSAAARRENQDRLIQSIGKMGFRLLLDEWVELERSGDSLVIAGVENWGSGRFPRYGNLQKATSGIPAGSFTVLLSHDPSHWDAQVLVNTNIQLTLSGHTHGFQFGIETPYFRWSPAQYRYPRWGGLYREGKQYLYVNRGLGYIGFPGRVGMPPEITCISLSSSA
ncbi:MAG: metallophosphoesterase, partial [Flavobacteriales bacterium]